MSSFRIIPHTADMAFEVEAPDWAALLDAATAALGEILRADDGRPAEVRRKVRVRGFDREDVLVAWLNEVVWLQEKEGFVPRRACFDSAGTEAAEGEMAGILLDRARESPDRVVKAVTYHDLRVVEGGDGRPWSARVVLDL